MKNSLRIRITGGFPERFLNLCAQGGIRITNVEPIQDGLIITVAVRDFKKLRPLAVTAGARIKVVEKKGVLFVWQKHKKRSVFFVGIVVCLLCLLLFSSFVWDVSVVGNEKISENEIKLLLSSCGFRSGVLKYNIKVSELQQRCLVQEPRLAWLWITFQGTHAVVTVREKQGDLAASHSMDPCDVVAKTDGLLTNVIVKEGQANVAIGDTVTRGQILIRRDTDAGRMTHADGEVWARTWYTDFYDISLMQTAYRLKEKTDTRHALLTQGKVIPLSFGKEPFAHTVKTISFQRVHIFKTLEMPFVIMHEYWQEAEPIVKKCSQAEAIQAAEEYLLQRFRSNMTVDQEIVNTSIKTAIMPNNILRVTMTIECLENIARQAF